MGGSGENGVHHILLPGLDADPAPAAPLLGGVGGRGHALDIAPAGEGEDVQLLGDEILEVDLVLHILDLGLAVVAELVGDGLQLLLEDAAHQGRVAQHLQVIGDLFLQLLVFVLQLFPVQTLQGLQPHIQDGLGLDVIQAEALAQPLLGVVVAGADDMDDLVNVVLGDEQAL